MVWEFLGAITNGIVDFKCYTFIFAKLNPLKCLQAHLTCKGLKLGHSFFEGLFASVLIFVCIGVES